MTKEHKQLEIGNRTIDVTEEFEDGYGQGRLYYYDTNNQLQQPLTSEQLDAFLVECFKQALKMPEWHSGFVVGLIAAFYENDPERGFTSTVLLP